jgi:hypothetical protein
MDELLEALLSREAMPGGTSTCRHCDKGAVAIWRCKDCLLGTPMCRECMRQFHKENPLHRIEKWNGGYFRPAELWEVGTYLLVKHHVGESVCNTLKVWCKHLEKGEERKDKLEQEHLCQTMHSGPNPGPGPEPEPEPFFEDDEIEETRTGEEDYNDEDDVEEEEEVEIPNAYLQGNTGDSASPGTTMPGTYVRVVHTNGLHHIAMVCCHCRGDDVVPLDLFASKLLPASFKRIKTLFTAQVLDLYRLCNLELKASAYQFYQLMRRLTRPMAPAEVPNLYREFRRMSRLWRWMKKLKWAGYSGSTKTVSDVGKGELAIYCPACPQPGINIPDNWRDDSARQANCFICIL